MKMVSVISLSHEVSRDVSCDCMPVLDENGDGDVGDDFYTSAIARTKSVLVRIP